MVPNYMMLVQKKTKDKEEEEGWPETCVDYAAAESFSFFGWENFPL